MIQPTNQKRETRSRRSLEADRLRSGGLAVGGSPMKIKNPLHTVKRFFDNEQQIWLSFVIAAGVMTLAYIVFGVWPVTQNSVLALDLNAQYVYYFAYIKDVLAGSESLFYSWSRNLSGEFVGILGYYLFSPFNFIVWAFPLEHITEGLLLMIVTKIGFIGVTMAVYLSKSRKATKTATVIFSVMYALTSYNIVQTMNPMWLDGVMVLPLVVMGVEALLREGKYKLLIFSLIYAFVTSFYIGYMVGIFSALYFIYYAFASRRAGRRNTAIILKRGGVFAVSAIVAVMCSCFILLPVYSSLSMGKLEFSDPDYSLRNSFSFLDITRKLFPGSYDTVRMEGMPFLYSGTLTAILLPLYFLCGRIRRAKRVCGAVLIIVLTVCMYITPVDMMWHGGQAPNWLPYRYSFMLCFLFLSFGADAFTHIKRISYKAVSLSALFLAALLVYWEQADTFVADLGSKGRDIFDGLSVALPALGILVLMTCFVIMSKNKLNKSRGVGVALIILVGLELFYNTAMGVVKQNTDITYSTRTSFNSVIIPTREVADRVQSEDPGFYRMEKTYFRSANDPMALGMKGVTHSSSLLNDEAINFLKRLGYASRSHASRYSGNTPLTDDLMGFKYTLSCLSDNTSYIQSAEDITVTENEDVMPIAYMVSDDVLDYSLNEDYVFNNQSSLLSLMLGEKDIGSYFVEMASDDVTTKNLTYAKVSENYERYEKINDGEEAYLEFFITAEYTGSYYMYLPSKYERKCDLYVNNESKGSYFETNDHHIKYLGDFRQGEEFIVKLKLTKDKVFFRYEQFMWLDTELLEADVARLHELNADTVFEAVSNTHLRVTTSNSEKGVLFTSIPDEPGWKVTLNGEKVDTVKIADTLMAVEVPAGDNVIELKFFPNYLPLGLGITALGVALFVFINAVSFKIPGKKGKEYVSDDYDGYDDDYADYDEEYIDFDFDDLDGGADNDGEWVDGGQKRRIDRRLDDTFLLLDDMNDNKNEAGKGTPESGEPEAVDAFEVMDVPEVDGVLEADGVFENTEVDGEVPKSDEGGYDNVIDD